MPSAVGAPVHGHLIGNPHPSEVAAVNPLTVWLEIVIEEIDIYMPVDVGIISGIPRVVRVGREWDREWKKER
jgi:hypothetical protein